MNIPLEALVKVEADKKEKAIGRVQVIVNEEAGLEVKSNAVAGVEKNGSESKSDSKLDSGSESESKCSSGSEKSKCGSGRESEIKKVEMEAKAKEKVKDEASAETYFLSTRTRLTVCLRSLSPGLYFPTIIIKSSFFTTLSEFRLQICNPIVVD